LALEEKIIRQDRESGSRRRFRWITGREGIFTDISFVFALFDNSVSIFFRYWLLYFDVLSLASFFIWMAEDIAC
jgi:hypothetical protein